MAPSFTRPLFNVVMVTSSKLSAVSSTLVVFSDAVVEVGVTNVCFVSPFPPSSSSAFSLSIMDLNSQPVSMNAAKTVNDSLFLILK